MACILLASRALRLPRTRLFVQGRATDHRLAKAQTTRGRGASHLPTRCRDSSRCLWTPRSRFPAPAWPQRDMTVFAAFSTAVARVSFETGLLLRCRWPLAAAFLNGAVLLVALALLFFVFRRQACGYVTSADDRYVIQPQPQDWSGQLMRQLSLDEYASVGFEPTPRRDWGLNPTPFGSSCEERPPTRIHPPSARSSGATE